MSSLCVGRNVQGSSLMRRAEMTSPPVRDLTRSSSHFAFSSLSLVTANRAPHNAAIPVGCCSVADCMRSPHHAKPPIEALRPETNELGEHERDRAGRPRLGVTGGGVTNRGTEV